MKTSFSKQTVIQIVCLTFFFAGLGGFHPEFLDELEKPFFDWRMRNFASTIPHEDTVLILATEKTFKVFGKWPWSRAYHANLLSKLEGSRLVVLDILFPEKSNEKDDVLLAETVARLGNVVIPMYLHPEEGGEGGKKQVTTPYPDLFSAGRDVGFVNLKQDGDGLLRFASPVFPLDGRFIPSLSLSAFRVYSKKDPFLSEGPLNLPILSLGERSVFLGEKAQIPIPYGKGYRTYEYVDVLQGKVPTNEFAGRNVFVGFSVAGLDPPYPVPLSGGSDMATGAQIHASLFDLFRYGRVPFRVPPAVDAFFSGTMALVAVVPALLLPPAGALGTIIFLSVAVLVLSFLMFQHLLMWISISSLLLAILGSCLFFSLTRLKRFSKRKEIQAFSIASIYKLVLSQLTPEISFEDFLKKVFEDLGKVLNVILLDPVMSLSTSLELIKDGNLDTGSGDALLLLKGNPGAPRFQLLVPLQGESEEYAVSYSRIGWEKDLSEEEIRSIAVVVITAHWFFKAWKASQQKREILNGTIKAMVNALEAKDTYTMGHSERVAELSGDLALKLGLTAEEAEEIYLGAMIHDLGKIGIPDRIIKKEGVLSREELEVMREHPLIGKRIMECVRLPKLSMEAIIQHHERLDGTGYPGFRSGQEIGLAGKVVAVADVYDALTSDRPYRKAISNEEALAYLCEKAGSDFDPSVVKCLVLLKAVGEMRKSLIEGIDRVPVS